MADDAAQVKITGDGQGALDTLRQVADAAKTGLNDIGTSMSGMGSIFGKIQGMFAALTVAIAGGAIFKAAIEDTAKMTEEAMDLARQLGTTTNQARVYQAAIEDVGASPGEFSAAMKGLSRNLAENETELKKLGLVTRDEAGQLRPLNDLMLDAITITNKYREGTDRAVASKQIFGRAVDGSSRLLLINKQTIDDNAKAVEELGLTVGKSAVAAWNDFDAAGDRANLSMQGIKKAIGDQLMPVITELVNMFNSVAPAAILVIRGALGGLATAFWGVRNGVIVLWETINAMVVTVAEPIRALAASIAKAVSGDFEGAKDEIQGIGNVIASQWELAMKNMEASSRKTSDAIVDLFMPDTGASTGNTIQGTQKATTKPENTTPEKKTPEPSFMAYYDMALAEEKRFAAERDALHEFSAAEEKTFWQTITDTYSVTSRDRIAISRRMVDLDIQILKEKARTAQQLDEQEIESSRQQALVSLQNAQEAAEGELAMDRITRAQLLQMQTDFENQRLQIEMNAALARKAMLDPSRDPVQYQAINLQIQELEQQHQLRLAQIRRQLMQEEANNPMARMWDGFTQGLQGALQGLLTGAMSFRQAWGSLWASMTSMMIGELVKMLAARAAAYVKEKAMQLAGISGDAAKAGSGAAASQASIPFIGPILAIAAMAAVFAAVAGMSSNVKSARSGFDIPSGMNPMTQLHEEEMVLPAHLANPLRETLANGGGGGDTHHHWNVQTMDSRSFQRFLEDNPDALMAGINNSRRNFHS